MSDRSAPLRVMADRIDRNSDAGFGGAFVIIPPVGDPRDILILDTSASPAIFWSTVRTHCDIALSDLEDLERKGQFGGFPPRR